VAGRIGDAELEPVDAHTCRLRSQADTLKYLAFQLVQLGCDFDVHEPPELRDHLLAMGSRITRAATGR
jgi:hypothetical protein